MIFLGLWVALLIGCVLMLIRNQVVYRIRMDALRIVSARAQRLIAEGDYAHWRDWYERLEERSYDSMMWDVFCWRLEQAYPWITALQPRRLPPHEPQMRVKP
jgi:hypothetical protein